MEAAGLVAAVVVWVAATAANLRLARARLASVPPAFRERPGAAADIEALSASGYVRYVLPLLPWFAGLAAYAALLSALGVLLALQLAAAVALATWWAWRTHVYFRHETAAFAEREGLELPKRPARERVVYEGTYYLGTLAIVLAGCFAGRLLWRLLA